MPELKNYNEIFWVIFKHCVNLKNEFLTKYFGVLSVYMRESHTWIQLLEALGKSFSSAKKDEFFKIFQKLSAASSRDIPSFYSNANGFIIYEKLVAWQKQVPLLSPSLITGRLLTFLTPWPWER